MTEYRFYAGIGSRETPLPICDKMAALAERLALSGWALRSGAADGADAAFERGCVQANGPAEIFLPWAKFNGHTSGIVAPKLPSWPEAITMATQYHPRKDQLKPAVQSLMARNAMQLLGPTLRQPARFVVFWAQGVEYDEDGKVKNCSGGTGQNIRTAYSLNIPLFHMEIHADRIDAFLAAPKTQSNQQPFEGKTK